MKNRRIWRLVWLISLNASLAVILYLVIVYKVKWETRDFSTYLYFYDCNNSVCSTTTKPDNIYSKFKCDNDKCPYISNFLNDILILTKGNSSLLFDYKKGEIFHNEYMNYKLLSDGTKYIVTDNNNKQGIMELDGVMVINPLYDEIIDYKYGLVVHKKDDLYGIDYASGEKVISPRYQYVSLIDNTLYIAKMNNKYQVYNIVNNSLKSNVEYDYLWTHNKLIVAIRDKKIDILNTLLDSKLLMKINTYYSYTRKSEINSLDIHGNDKFIYFNVNLSNNEIVKYRYNLADSKIEIIE